MHTLTIRNINGTQHISRMIKPPALKKGDTVVFLSPSGSLAALTPHRVERAKKWFEKSGYTVEIYESVSKSEELHSAVSPEEAAHELHQAFTDSNVKAIICSVGGIVANKVLPLLDYDLIRENPTIFCGYSDITNYHCAMQTQANLVTFYGPAVVTQFGEWPEPHEYTVKNFFQAVQQTNGRRKIEASTEWTDDKTVDYVEKTDTGYHRTYQNNSGYTWLHEGKATGILVGGCITSLMNLRSTSYYPDMKNKILLLETSEGTDYTKGQSLGDIESYLQNLRLDGTFEKIAGIVFGRGFGYAEDQHEILQSLVTNMTEDKNIPVVHNVDAGHTDPINTWPLGVEISIDSAENGIVLKDSAVY